jgi:16S rRNA (adenine1518-N6/adenine1519-N6)-dimethyltransferase
VIGLLEARGSWRRACLLLQREFAVRVAAPPGTRACGTLSALAALWTHPTVAFHVGSASFFPRPKVESVVLVLEPRTEPAADIGDEATFRRVVKALFSQRRKMARKALKPLCENTSQVLESAGLDPTRRGETFTIEELAALSRALSEQRRAVLLTQDGE